MTLPSPTMLRCDRCRAVISTAEASDMIRHGVPCGVCGGTLVLGSNAQRRTADGLAGGDAATLTGSPERRLLGVLRDADGESVKPSTLAEAGIADLGDAIFELEQAGHHIERAYADASNGRRRFLGYRLRRRRGRQAGGSQPSSSR